MLARLAALSLVLATPALAQDQNRSGIVRGLCQKDGCDEFSLVSRDRLTETPEGTLYRTRVKTFHASGGGRREQGEENGYVYCSATKPAIMAEQGGRTTAFYLAPFATQDSRETVRKNANFHALYFSICHGAEAGRTAVRDLAEVARAHGYQVPLARSRLAQLNRAEDVISPAAASASAPSTAPVQAERRPPAPERAASETLRRASVPPQRIGRTDPPRREAEEEEGLLDARTWRRQAGEAIEEVGNWATDLGRSLR